MRTSGILMPVFSLPGKYGIGTFGKEAYHFVDFLEKAGQHYWQLLPLNPTNYGDSPYQSFSSAAGNPYFIDLELLTEEGLLTEADYAEVDFGQDSTAIDYGKLYENRLPVLRRAYERFTGGTAYRAFCREQADWLEEYVLFMAIKDAHNGVSWREWPKELKRRQPRALAAFRQAHEKDMDFYRFIQFLFFTQWRRLKAYANEKNIEIIGDMPIYVADDSVDVWSEPEQFDLDEKLLPKVVAGCPPDAFAPEGQLWGMPVYRFEAMAKETPSFGWWRRRMRHTFAMYDVVRIDHFRGLESYYCIPYGAENAVKGTWRKGPGMALFKALKEEFGEQLPIIAEDLGFLTQDVRDLLEESGFPGMRVLQFAFDGKPENEYLPHSHCRNTVVYTGTHDNDTVMGWIATASTAEVALARRYLHVDDHEGFNWAMIRGAMMSVADTAIFTMADIMGLGSEARINRPSTLGEGNWCWRIGDGCINDWLAGIIMENTRLYGRAPVKTAVKKREAPALPNERKG